MSERRDGLEVPSLGQVGIVVEDIDRSVRYYQDVFGIGPWAVFRGEPRRCLDRGNEISFSGRMAMAQSGRVQLELIQILEGDTIHTEFLHREGEGIHHLGFFVRDLKRRLELAKEAGIEVLQHGLLKQAGLSIEYAYLDTREIGGVIIEYIEPRFLGLPVPLRITLLRLGAWISEHLRAG